MKQYKKLISFVCLIVALVLPQLLLAADLPSPLDTLDNIASGERGPYKEAMDTDLMEIIGTVISLALGLLGVIFLVLMIYAGYNWMTARGEEDKVATAKDTIIRAVIGIVIVVGSYAIWRFIFIRLLFQ